jgi:hypothetical protein
MNRFLVVDIVQLNTINRFAMTGVVREGTVFAGMHAYYTSSPANVGLEIMKVDLLGKGATPTDFQIALLLRLDDVVESGLNKKEFWIGKEIQCS